MDYNYTGILIDIDNSLRELNRSVRQASKPQPKPNQTKETFTKADFIREIAPKIALTIAPNGKVDFPSVIQLASSWYNDIEEYISDMDSEKQTEYSSVVFPQEDSEVSEVEDKDKEKFNKAIADIF